ncbi:MAG: 4Fe-4S dicluster domain-containing protein [Firmicutes bacterium]|nr:4Fe-4S dicluster domain-containing protein [Bacillota bacterium]
MRLQPNPEKCTGCQICEAFCSFKKERAVWPARSRISVLKWEKEGVYIPFTCQQCERPLCQEACPVGAIGRCEATGALEVDSRRCLGCKMCVTACPFGGMAYDPDRGQAIKCDLCGGDPECVRMCPFGALTFIREEKYAQVKRREAARKLAGLLDLVGR